MAKKEYQETSSESDGEITIDSNIDGPLNTEELEKAFAKKEGKTSSEENMDSQLMEENEKLKSELLYLRAEFDNFRKNSIKERSETIKYGAERFIRQLLSVIDNFDRALSMEITPENYKDFIAGIELTSNEFKTQLANMGVTISNPLGQAFDPTVHEALSSEESDKVKPGYITRVFQMGYSLHDKIIRPAQVVVAKEINKKEKEAFDTDVNNDEDTQV
ncbi:MAG: nucleotide exchange factor GrpE [Bdellovibrionaceae bacterium]|nr:nucleotide exchange factor GrpE [Pseudobdellovibrionaceae bacterium]